MAMFSVNSNRFDPYRNFKFRIKWDNQYVAGLSEASPLSRSTEVVTWRSGGDVTPRNMPGNTTYAPVTLGRGVTHDTAFEDWANQVNQYTSDAAMSLKDYRKEVVIDVFNLQGAKALSYVLHRCWVSQYVALPELDASGSDVMIQKITIETEGWQRDRTIAEPTES